MKTLITRKVGMTSTIGDNGVVQAITLLSATPNVITQLKHTEQDGYQALQLGFEEDKHLNKAQIGHNKSAKASPKVVREFRVQDLTEEVKVGDTLSAETFAVGDEVDATATSKGKGWTGTIARHNFKRGRKTHGGRSYRRVGSIGSMYPQKIFKGKRMAGQSGGERVTVKRLKIALVDSEHNVIGVTGSVPGPRRSIVLLQEAK